MVTFVPHLVPLDRGILETIYVSLRQGTTENQVTDALQRAYASTQVPAGSVTQVASRAPSITTMPSS